MQTNLDRFLAYRGILLLVLLSSAGCFSAVKQKNKDAGAPKVDTSALDTSQGGMDTFNGSGGTVVIDASGGGGVPSSGGVGAGGVLGGGGSFSTGGNSGSGGTLSTGGNSGSGGAVVDASTPDVPLASDGSDATTTLSNGSRCTADAQCTNGHCADGVCCDGKCDGQCQSCAESGSVGQCLTVKGDPRGQRTACTGTAPCKGQCDGINAAACTYPGSSTTCSQASCASGILTPASYCDSSGNCPAVKAAACASNVCTADNKTCASSCAGVACGAGSYCDGITCVPKKTSGPCSSAGECSTGFCADGVCCNTPCTEQCKACNLSGSSGTCTRLTTGAPASGHAACAGSDKCAGSCNSTSDSCVYPSTSQKCGAAATCSTDLTTVSFSACDAKGDCVPATQGCGSSSYCSNASCTGKLSSGSCTSNVQCANGNCSNSTCCGAGQTGCGSSCCDTSANYCSNGTCIPKGPPGNTCQAATQCTTGYCVSNTCCNSAQCSSDQTCSSGSCACRLGTAACGHCLGWTFDSCLSDPNWELDPDTSNNAASLATVTSAKTYGGSGCSFAAHVSTDETTFAVAAIRVNLCASSTTAGVRTFSMEVFFDGPDLSAVSQAGQMIFFDASGNRLDGYGLYPVALSSGNWIAFTGSLDSAVAANYVVFQFLPKTTGWSGLMYIDNVAFQ